MKRKLSGKWGCAAGIVLLLLGVLGTCSATPNITRCSSFAPPAILKGRKFFDSVSGAYIPIKGIAYYPRPNTGNLSVTNSIDFTAEEHRATWERDITNLKNLNINVVRIYAVEPGLNHDGFMCALRAAGIYAIIELAAGCVGCTIINQTAPDCYPASLKTRGQFIISEFARYDNVLAFSAGNEVSLGTTDITVNAPCQKQFLRDMRAFIQACNSTVRHIPVGVAFADSLRKINALWYGCRSVVDDELENAEYIGINVYVDCNGKATTVDQLDGFKALLADFASYNLTAPVVLTEFGCINPSFPTIGIYEAQRTFLSVEALFSSLYRAQFVGGAVFEYSTELRQSFAPFPFTTYGAGNFGVGYFEPKNCDEFDVPCNYTTFPQFGILATQYGAVDTSDEPSLSDYSFNETLPACPSQFSPLNTYTWASASIPDHACPNIVYGNCTMIPAECNNLGIPTPAPVPAPPTSAPVASAPTQMPAPSTSAPVASAPTQMPGTAAPAPVVSSDIPSDLPSGVPKVAPDAPVFGAPVVAPSKNVSPPVSQPSFTSPTGSNSSKQPTSSSFPVAAMSKLAFCLLTSAWLFIQN